MSVRPVEMLTMMPRLNEAGRLHHNAEVSPYAAQHAAAVQAAEKSLRDQQQVQHGQAADKAIIRKEPDKQGGGGQRQGATPEQRHNARPQPKGKAPTGRLDVKI